MASFRLPILSEEHAPGAGSLGRDGKRLRPYPADVHGPWLRARRVVYYGLIALWVALPWIPLNGHPAVFIDVERRHFFLFGATFNAQDLWLMFFLVSGFGFGLLYVTSVLGRVWCGWSCPQTVFIEAVFRPIERFVNGPRNKALHRSGGDRIARLALTHALYILAAFVIAHVFLAYFVSLPATFAMVRAQPAAHPEAFAWAMAITALFYGVFGVFREQFCVVVCPYGRLQSVLLDDDALVVGYDEKRGEPREKGKEKLFGAGDCVDCHRCVVVCPTGIDIREGLQLDCIACTACIDACDEVMLRLDRPSGLVRYDSLRGLRGEKRRFFRPRILIYSVLLAVGVVVFAVAAHGRKPFEANLLRLPGAPYTRAGDRLQNAFEIHLVNKSGDAKTFELSSESDARLTLLIPITTVAIEPLGSRRIPVFATTPTATYEDGSKIRIHVSTTGAASDVSASFLGARSP